jgi:hypothetical protein
MKQKSIFLLLPLLIVLALVTASVCVAKPAGQEMGPRDHEFGQKGLMEAGGHGPGLKGPGGHGPGPMEYRGQLRHVGPWGREGQWRQGGHQWRQGGQWGHEGQRGGWDRYRHHHHRHHGHHGHHGHHEYGGYRR